MRWVGLVSWIGVGSGVYRVLLGKPVGKGPLGNRSGREDNIKVDLQEVGCGVWTGLNWIRIGTGSGHL
jgi:hypothetical protein